MTLEQKLKDKINHQTGQTLENVILLSRYLLIPLYFALLFRIVMLIFDFYRAQMGAPEETLANHTLMVLQLLDITMVANFIWFTSAGSYYVFIDTHDSGKKRPRSLIHLSAGILKEKMAGSLIGVSSVHLLQVFLHLSTQEGPLDWNKMGAMLAIHGIFIIGLLAFAHINEADHHMHPDDKETVPHEKPH